MDKKRETGVLVIATTLVAAIKLRGEPINNSPRVPWSHRGFNPVGPHGARAAGAGVSSEHGLREAASLIAAVRTARETEIKPSPRVICTVDDSLRLAKMALKRIEREP